MAYIPYLSIKSRKNYHSDDEHLAFSDLLMPALEDGALEVETGFCNYLSVAQSIKAPINKGDNIHIVLWHGQLRFDQPEEAHVAISVNGAVIWEDEIEIPNDGGIYDISVPSTVAADIGDQVEYHLHNHGYNTWTLLILDVQRANGP